MQSNLSIFLAFGGNCQQAMDFYADVFKTTPGRVMRYADAGYEESIDEIANSNIDYLPLSSR